MFNETILKNAERFIKHGLIAAELDSLKIVYFNQAAKDIFVPREMDIGQPLSQFLNEKQIYEILSNRKESHVGIDNNRFLKVSASQDDSYVILTLEDQTERITLEEENKYLFLLNKQLREVYDVYSYDTICITDEKGIVEFSGEACERHCGITHKDIVGMDMRELEKDKVFYPSVTLRVIASGKEEVVLQESLIGVTLCTIGVPVFDEDGNLRKVISISRDFSKEIEIAKSIIEIRSMQAHEEEQRIESASIMTCSETVYGLMRKMSKAAKTNTTILIDGETGTGKTLFANYIHSKSKRSDMPFVVVNCGAIPENLIESELFGYERGAFTGANEKGKAGLIEMAQGGTIFFDEIGELPLQQQVKLLHVLQDKSITRVGGRHAIKLNVRVIAATNKNLYRMVEEGTFREDLYYRLNVINFTIPRLVERSEDIPLLITHFLHKYNKENEENKEITERAIHHLKQYAWPGNIRELENLIEMVCVITSGDMIDLKDLPAKIFRGDIPDEARARPVVVKKIVTIKEAIEVMERQLIKLSMEKCGGNQQQIANLLGVDRSTITRKINAYGLKKG